MSDHLGSGVWRVLAIDDDQESLDRIKDLLEVEPLPSAGFVEVTTETCFDAALSHLDRHRVDLVVLDIRLGDNEPADEEAGLRTRDQIHAVRFLPIVFYTGLPNWANSTDEEPFIAVVTKGEAATALADSVDRLLASGPPQVQRALVRELENVIRSFMLDYVKPQWAAAFTTETGKSNLAHILARRLSAALTGAELERLVAELDFPVTPGSVSPLRYYLIPPVGNAPKVGDLHYIAGPETSASPESWWVVLTPTCDLVHGKADFALLARCNPLDCTPAFQNVAGNLQPSKTQKSNLKTILRNNESPRMFYLPAAFEIPHLIVDFQDLRTIRGERLACMEPSASLDSPYAEELQARFTSYFGRVGTPDLDWAAIMQSIQGRE